MLKELAPEAPEDAPFGQYLFAPDRKDLAGEEKKESNTDAEMHFRDALFDHYLGDSYLLGTLAQKVKAMVDKGWYTKILAAPETTVYRWISDVSMEAAANMLKTSVEDLEESAGRATKYGPGVMVPGGIIGADSKIHSWTTKLDEEWILADLQPPPLQPGQTAMILVARTSRRNFFINPKGIADVERMPRYAYYQDEVISHGPIEFETACVLSNSKHSKERIKGNDALYQLIESME